MDWHVVGASDPVAPDYRWCRSNALQGDRTGHSWLKVCCWP